MPSRDTDVNTPDRHARPFGFGRVPLGITEQAANEIFSLPMNPSLTDAEQDRVCDALHEMLQTFGDSAR